MEVTKLLVVFMSVGFFVLLIQADEECEKKMQAFTSECQTKLNATDDVVSAMSNKPPFPQQTKCLIKCIVEKLEVFKNGKLVESKVKAMIKNMTASDTNNGRQKALGLLSQCKRLSGSNACDTAAMMFTCAKDGALRLGLDKH